MSCDDHTPLIVFSPCHASYLSPDPPHPSYSVQAASTGSYEAHSDREVRDSWSSLRCMPSHPPPAPPLPHAQVLVLLDCTHSADMLEEGVAQEVVNKVQKLRKKVGHPHHSVSVVGGYSFTPVKGGG